MAGEIIFYQSDDGTIRLETRLENETLWLTQQQMAELFQTTQQNVSQHIKNIYTEDELTVEATNKKILWVRQEGTRQIQRELDSYNLDMVVSVHRREAKESLGEVDLMRELTAITKRFSENT